MRRHKTEPCELAELVADVRTLASKIDVLMQYKIMVERLILQQDSILTLLRSIEAERKLGWVEWVGGTSWIRTLLECARRYGIVK